MPYEVIEAYSLRELSEAVSQKMAEGWKCQGGIAVLGEEGRIRYLQAIVHPARFPR